jgi:hypothetical protein
LISNPFNAALNPEGSAALRDQHTAEIEEIKSDKKVMKQSFSVKTGRILFALDNLDGRKPRRRHFCLSSEQALTARHLPR